MQVSEALLPTLRNNELILKPTSLEESREYILLLADEDRYKRTPVQELDTPLQYVQNVWIAEVDGHRIGVLIICYIPELDWWTFDAYRDKNLDNKLGDYSYTAAKFVLNWFFNNPPVYKEIHAMHTIPNRAARMMCKRLGFKDKSIIDQINIMVKGR